MCVLHGTCAPEFLDSDLDFSIVANRPSIVNRPSMVNRPSSKMYCALVRGRDLCPTPSGAGDKVLAMAGSGVDKARK